MPDLICLYGGTFDPVHYGHLKPLSEMQQKLAADRVYIVPAAIPPHRPAPRSDGQQRVEMLQLALQEYPEIILDRRELERSGPSWTVLTLQSFRQQYSDDSLCLVMGSDAFNGLPTWYHWQEILQLANIIVIERAGAEVFTAADWAVEYMIDDMSVLRQQKNGSILPVRLTGYAISSTEIRHKLYAGQDVDGMLPAAVLDYIHKHGLYQNEQ